MSETVETMHWQKLKKLVEEKGGVYQNRKQAIEFMTSPAEEAEAVTTEEMPEGLSDVQVQQINTDIELDKDKPFGEVFGGIDNIPGARFVQDGRYFNAAGKNVG